MNNLLGAVSGIAIAVYTLVVVYKGNLATLGTLLKQDAAYLEFLAALVALALIHNALPENTITDMISIIALIALGMKFFANTNISSALADFGSGKKTMLETIQAIFPQQTGTATNG